MRFVNDGFETGGAKTFARHLPVQMRYRPLGARGQLTSDVTRSPATLRVVATYEPAEIARELGYTDEHRPGKVIRDYLRKKYPDHPKYQRWVLDEIQAADVRVNVPRKR